MFSFDEQQFLASQGLSEEDFFDARFMSKHDRDEFYKLHKTPFMIGANCKKAGHRLRTSKGHCIQCDTSKIAYMLRGRVSGCVYIAGSKKLQLIKIGCTGDIENRTTTLNQTEYAGVDDWRVLFFVAGPNAGNLEEELQAVLDDYVVQDQALVDNRGQVAHELFRFNASAAVEILKMAIKDRPEFSQHVTLTPIERYDF